MFIRALRALSKLLRSPIRGGAFGDKRAGVFTLDHATLDDFIYSGDQSSRIGFSVWLEDADREPNYVLELGKVEDSWTVTREALSYRGFQFDSTEQPFEFGTAHRGTIRWETPGFPPRHAALPHLLFPYRGDPVALPRVGPVLAFSSALGLAYAYRVNPEDLTTPTLPNWIDPSEPYVDSTGTGFIHTLREWSQSVEGKQVFEQKVLPQLQRLFPHIRGIGFRGMGSKLFLEYQTDRSSRAVPAQLESDGVNLGLFFLSIPHLLMRGFQAEALCLGLEEPEAGTHPHFQAYRLELLRRLASGELTDVSLQIIATTHSVDLLRWVQPDEALGVLRFAEHLGPEQGTLIHRLTNQEDIDRVYEEYHGNPGIAWYSGVFGGVPRKPSASEE
jgi:hypothetical protein